MALVRDQSVVVPLMPLAVIATDSKVEAVAIRLRAVAAMARIRTVIRRRFHASRLRAGKPSRHEPKKRHAGQLVLAGDIGTHPSREFFHRLVAPGRRIRDANLRSTSILSIRLKYALGKSVAEIQAGEAGFTGGRDGACGSEIASRPNAQVHGWWLWCLGRHGRVHRYGANQGQTEIADNSHRAPHGIGAPFHGCARPPSQP